MNNEKLKGFLGIPFGSNQETVIEKLKERNGILDSETPDGQTLFFSGITFAGRPTEGVLVNFFENKFCKAIVLIQPKLESRVVDTYRQIKNEINEKYYISKSDFESYDPPYEKNDGCTETAISLGKANFSCFWNFGESTPTDDYISIDINEDFEISIAYENGELMTLLVEKEKAKNILDY